MPDTLDLRQRLMRADSKSAPVSHGKSEDALPLCKKWLEQCCKSHPACFATRTIAPTRLVYVGDGLIRLCDPTKLKSVLKYAALSHCWGTIPFCTLVTANLNTFHQNTPEDVLTKTFRDSSTITRSLGLEYISTGCAPIYSRTPLVSILNEK